MVRLRVGSLIVGITTGLVALLGFFWTLPDGRLHLVFCNVGQGDAAYVRFPDGRDMLVDGGPNRAVLDCLGRHMPFWDRKLDLVVLTHPQRDHLQGLIAVLARLRVDYVVRSDIANDTEGYRQFISSISSQKLRVRYVASGEAISVGPVTLSVLWPSQEQIAIFKRHPLASPQGDALSSSVLGARAPENLNDGSIVFSLRYGSFDALFTGDADTRVESGWKNMRLADDTLEVLKFPHHGSRTAMSEAFLAALKPRLAVISVGKNSYGHPAQETLATLARLGIPVKRTDREGDIEIVSDGRAWEVKRGRFRF